MKALYITIGLCLSIFTLNAWSCTADGSEGIVPDNNLFISVGDKSAAGITEEDFHSAIDMADAIYRPIIEEMGKELVINRNWTDGTVNAYAQQSGNTWFVSMFGGLARHETITKDGFMLVVCHELGHHLGGAPKKKTFWSSSWASNEGQADYWGNLKCMRKILEKEDNLAVIKNMEIPEVVQTQCAEQFEHEKEQAICIRTAMAGKSLGELFRALRGQKDEIKFDTPDQSKVSKTDHNHPASQCRLDTYFAGALCNADHYQDVDDSDAEIGTCVRSEEMVLGVRPLCWYKP
jgi:hypothetical protein